METLCRQLDVPVRLVELDVAAEAAANGIGIEEAARGARFRWLEQVAVESGCTHIAVAHTADDQAEKRVGRTWPARISRARSCAV